MNIIAGRVDLDGDEVTIIAKKFKTCFPIRDIRDAELFRRSIPPQLILLLHSGQIYNLMFSRGMEDAFHLLKSHPDFSADGALNRRSIVAIICLLVLIPVLGVIVCLLTYLYYR